jgi:hypothetical protein
MCFAYAEGVFVALGIQHAVHVSHIVICGLPDSTIFFPHRLINGMILDKKLKCVLTFSTTFACKIFHSNKN